LLDALNRHRGKGQQKVTVEHVHEGGQAIVGNVESRGEGLHRKTVAAGCTAGRRYTAQAMERRPHRDFRAPDHAI
jgi:hypothetical protein